MPDRDNREIEALIDRRINEFRQELGIWGECECCHQNANLIRDHDHVTDLNRGKICMPCNLALGHFRDDPRRLESAIAYLKKYQVLHFQLTGQQRKLAKWRYWDTHSARERDAKRKKKKGSK